MILVAVICTSGGFLFGQLGNISDSRECEKQARDLLDKLEKRERLYEKLRAQSEEFSQIAKAAVEQRDAIEKRCSVPNSDVSSLGTKDSMPGE